MESQTLKKILSEFIEKGQFENVFIADENGLPLVFAGSNLQESENQAALFARMKKNITMMDDHSGFNNISELSVQMEGKKIVCRYIKLGNNPLFLAITLNSHLSYKRLTRSLIHQLQLIWKD